ncbi:hypothetical protein PPERSA_09607 [Pseudocohnilembus persalinus]|uniref:Peptidase M14 domain-containing protein n=1 Tax=Pseudocohnilembus persalinus TaxID=266149 RepID=A0A0V0QFL9_PSEPJ|nr:hypothetical protein PPERSA_09607 [Pseudocohnilembus persalinus]|eukprot:KRX01001.1 hypothetical protein PPERSA_09607 [Pseudocohnilembus persalinus]
MKIFTAVLENEDYDNYQWDSEKFEIFDLKYKQNNFLKQHLKQQNESYYNTLEFKINLNPTIKRVLFAPSLPYTFTDFITNLEFLEHNLKKAPYFKQSLLKSENNKINIENEFVTYQKSIIGQTYIGLPIYALQITGQILENTLHTVLPQNQRQEMLDNKIEKDQRKIIVFISRQQPKDSASSFIIQGILKTLMKNFASPLVRKINQLFKFVIIPFVNVDGVVIGNSQCNFLGHLLNKRWDRDINLQENKEISYIKEFLKTNVMINHQKIYMFMDFESKFFSLKIFSYILVVFNLYLCIKQFVASHTEKGCYIIGQEDKQDYNNVDWICQRLFPKILRKFSPYFKDFLSYFESQGKKTARSYFLNELQTTYSYTCVASIFGQRISQNNIQYDQNNYEDIGKQILKSLLAFHVVEQKAVQESQQQNGQLQIPFDQEQIKSASPIKNRQSVVEQKRPQEPETFDELSNQSNISDVIDEQSSCKSSEFELNNLQQNAQKENQQNHNNDIPSDSDEDLLGYKIRTRRQTINKIYQIKHDIIKKKIEQRKNQLSTIQSKFSIQQTFNPNKQSDSQLNLQQIQEHDAYNEKQTDQFKFNKTQSDSCDTNTDNFKKIKTLTDLRNNSGQGFRQIQKYIENSPQSKSAGKFKKIISYPTGGKSKQEQINNNKYTQFFSAIFSKKGRNKKQQTELQNQNRFKKNQDGQQSQENYREDENKQCESEYENENENENENLSEKNGYKNQYNVVKNIHNLQHNSFNYNKSSIMQSTFNYEKEFISPKINEKQGHLQQLKSQQSNKKRQHSTKNKNNQEQKQNIAHIQYQKQKISQQQSIKKKNDIVEQIQGNDENSMSKTQNQLIKTQHKFFQTHLNFINQNSFASATNIQNQTNQGPQGFFNSASLKKNYQYKKQDKFAKLNSEKKNIDLKIMLSNLENYKGKNYYKQQDNFLKNNKQEKEIQQINQYVQQLQFYNNKNNPEQNILNKDNVMKNMLSVKQLPKKIIINTNQKGLQGKKALKTQENTRTIVFSNQKNQSKQRSLTAYQQQAKIEQKQMNNMDIDIIQSRKYLANQLGQTINLNKNDTNNNNNESSSGQKQLAKKRHASAGKIKYPINLQYYNQTQRKQNNNLIYSQNNHQEDQLYTNQNTYNNFYQNEMQDEKFNNNLQDFSNHFNYNGTIQNNDVANRAIKCQIDLFRTTVSSKKQLINNKNNFHHNSALKFTEMAYKSSRQNISSHKKSTIYSSKKMLKKNNFVDQNSTIQRENSNLNYESIQDNLFQTSNGMNMRSKSAIHGSRKKY